VTNHTQVGVFVIQLPEQGVRAISAAIVDEQQLVAQTERNQGRAERGV